MPTALANLLRTHIATHGPLTVHDFMAHALYHPQHGYYTTGHNFLPLPNPLTPLLPNPQPYPHDFTTAPELTPLFSYTLANWVNTQWQQAGNPSPYVLMECGPGRGILMRDLLTHLQAAHPACYHATHPLLVETSPALTALQQSTLATFPQCRWSITPTTSQPTILIANELLDAFPTHQYILRKGAWHERLIALTPSLMFTVTESPEPTTSPLLPNPLTPSHPNPLPEGTITELSPLQTEWLTALPDTLLAALFADYGATTSGPTGDTLQALHRHTRTDIFHRIGETDLTTHVNFTATAAALTTRFANHALRVTNHALAPFLLANGLPTIALALQDAGMSHPGQDTALQRLLHPAQMGTLFKVQCLTP